MMLNQEEQRALLLYRTEKAKLTMAEAEGIAKQGYWNATANRLYYAAFYMVTALLIKHGLSTQTHGGVIRLFGLHFIKEGIVDKQIGDIYTQLFELRQTGDYEDLYMLDEAKVSPFIGLTRQLISTIEELI